MRAPVLLLALSFAAGLSAQAATAPKNLCQQLEAAVPGSLSPGKLLPAPKAEVLTAIGAVVPGALDGAAVYAVEHTWPDDEPAEARLAVLPLDGGRKLLLLAATDRQFRGGAVVDQDGKLVAEWNAFLGQFQGMLVPRLAASLPTAAVQKRLATLDSSSDEQGKAGAALVDVRRQMVRQHGASVAVQRALDQDKAPPAAAVDTMRAAYTAMQQRAAALHPLLGEAQKDYDRLVGDVLASLAALPQATDKQKRAAALQKLKGSCRDCHALESDGWKGELENFAAKERRRLELGGQAFLLGYDVFADGKDPKAAQALADACYRGALLIDASMK